MRLHLSDPTYSDRLATFLQSVGQTATLRAPGQLDVDLAADDSSRNELEIYLRVWGALYPDASVHVASGADEEEPAA